MPDSENSTGIVCPKCSTPMTLTRIDPDKPGFDIRTFECSKCGYTQSKVFKIL
jgi:uncharacterized metal-binding protein (TIGR02443 family)